MRTQNQDLLRDSKKLLAELTTQREINRQLTIILERHYQHKLKDTKNLDEAITNALERKPLKRPHPYSV